MLPRKLRKTHALIWTVSQGFLFFWKWLVIDSGKPTEWIWMIMAGNDIFHNLRHFFFSQKVKNWFFYPKNIHYYNLWLYMNQYVTFTLGQGQRSLMTLKVLISSFLHIYLFIVIENVPSLMLCKFWYLIHGESSLLLIQ